MTWPANHSAAGSHTRGSRREIESPSGARLGENKYMKTLLATRRVRQRRFRRRTFPGSRDNPQKQRLDRTFNLCCILFPKNLCPDPFKVDHVAKPVTSEVFGKHSGPTIHTKIDKPQGQKQYKCKPPNICRSTPPATLPATPPAGTFSTLLQLTARCMHMYYVPCPM